MTDSVIIKVKRLPHGDRLPLPQYETLDSAGMDLYAALGKGETVTLGSLERAMIPTGLSMALPHSYEAQIRPRSGLAAKNGITCLNTPGTIDADYRGEVKVILVNLSHEPFTIERGMRIAQMIIAPVTQGRWSEVSELSITERGEGGFGSTGTR